MLLKKFLQKVRQLWLVCTKRMQPALPLILSQRERIIQVRANFLPAVWSKCGHASSDLHVSPNLAVQIDASSLPLALHGAFRDAPHGGNFGKREATKKF